MKVRVSRSSSEKIEKKSNLIYPTDFVLMFGRKESLGVDSIRQLVFSYLENKSMYLMVFPPPVPSEI